MFRLYCCNKAKNIFIAVNEFSWMSVDGLRVLQYSVLCFKHMLVISVTYDSFFLCVPEASTEGLLLFLLVLREQVFIQNRARLMCRFADIICRY